MNYRTAVQASQPSHPLHKPQLPQLTTARPVAAKQIDSESAESFIGEKKIGERIKRLRLKRSMGLVEMGKHTGLSASFLSQLETGRVVPTLRNLARIAMVFNKDLSYFFDPEPHTLFRVHRKTERVAMPQSGVNDPTYFFESLAYLVPDRTLDPYIAEFIPIKKDVEVRSHVHTGFEFLYVLAGQMDIRHGGHTQILEPGDSVYFDASTPHSYRCAGSEKANVIIVTQHQMTMPQPALTSLNGRTTAVASSGTSHNVALGSPDKREAIAEKARADRTTYPINNRISNAGSSNVAAAKQA